MRTTIRKVIIMNGGVETLDYFSNQMAGEFQNMGLSVFVFDLRNVAGSVRKVRKFIKTGKTALITFNFEGLEREKELYSPDRGYLWQEYGMDCYNIAADHPYCYDNRFRDLLEDEKHHPGLLACYHHLSIDRNHERYLRDFYPEFEDAGFLPLAGTNPYPEEPLPGQGARSIDVLFTGNYTEPTFFDKNIHWINEEYARFYQGIIEDLTAHPNRTIEEVEIEHCKREMGESSAAELRPAIHKMMFIDLYLRNYYRGQVVASILNAGIPVTVIGKGWENLECDHPEKLTILAQTDSKTCLMQLRRAKVSLNVMPWFKDGTHDRVFNSILNGAVCLTDSSGYLSQELREGQGLCYYDLTEIDQIPGKVTELLSDDSLRQKMIQSSLITVQEKHAWNTRARELVRIMGDMNPE